MGQTVLGQLLPIGSVVHSMLTESQFQAEMGSGWVLSDGRSVAGSRYASIVGVSTVPDVRGRFLRAKNNGSSSNPDGDLALGTYSADKYTSHDHQQRYTTDGATAIPSTLSNFLVGSTVAAKGMSGASYSIGGTALIPFNTTASGGNETAPKSITVNVFIRIN